MTWLLAGILLACVALSTLAYIRDGWELWRSRRLRRLLRTGSIDSRGALRAFAIGLRALNQGWICRVLGRWRLRWDLWRLRRAQRRTRAARGDALAPALQQLVDKVGADTLRRAMGEIEDLLSRRDL